MQTTSTTAANRKATHSGTCQCCGSLQKLPGGVLSKHGYTVRLGFFDGVCMGAGELPFEQSKDLVELFIARAEDRLAGVRAMQAKLREPATAPVAWVQDYRPAAWGTGGRSIRGGYEWREVELTATERSNPGSDYKWIEYTYTSVSGKSQKVEIYGHECMSAGVLAVAGELNARRAEALEATVKQITDYIAWQRGRIAGWAPAPLKPIK